MAVFETPDWVNQKLNVERVNKNGRPLEMPKKKIARIRRSRSFESERAFEIINCQISEIIHCGDSIRTSCIIQVFDRKFAIKWHPQGDSNPRCRRERAVS